MKQRKASLSLSVNAIVVLILAITMLGLGLGFIRGMFTKVSTSLEQQISTESDPPGATGSTPITLSREVIITNAGKTEVIKVGVYNPSNATWTSESPDISCTEITFTEEVNDKTLDPGESETYIVQIPIPKGTPGDATYLCQVKMPQVNPEYYKDLTIKVVA